MIQTTKPPSGPTRSSKSVSNFLRVCDSKKQKKAAETIATAQALASSNAGLLAEQHLALRRYLREGLYYKEAAAQVAVGDEAL
eukprot:m.39155 g.39155  ORF g.39155 m.39155 type:complete len:83 (+) comp45490_c0_seq3:1193-1441(+)